MKLSYRGSTLGDMPRGNPAPKLSITVDPEVHESVVAAAAADGVSISAWMTMAARRALIAQDGLAGIVAWELEHGVLTEGEMTDARRRVLSEVAPDQRLA